MTTFAPSAAQQAYFDWIVNDTGSAVLEAVAGAGKTTTIVRGLDYMSGQIILLAYNADMAKELYARIGGRPGVFAKTFHSVGFAALRYAYGKTHKLEISAGKVAKLTKAVILEKSRDELLPLVAAVSGIVSMAKQRGIGALTPLGDDEAWLSMVDHFALDASLPDGHEGALLTAIKLSQEVLRRSNADLDVIDFDDMVYLPLQRRLKLLQHDWVLVDEAQDTNPTRRALAAALLRPGRGRLVCVGDPAQSIYGFSGTDNDSLKQLSDAFACKHLPLTVSYRCPKAVVEVAWRYADHITAHESAPEGCVTEYAFSEVMDYVQPGDAVLCRYNKYLVSLAFRLIRGGVAARILGRDVSAGLVKLATRWSRVTTLGALEGKLEEWREREVSKAKAKDDSRRADNAVDTVETMAVLIARTRETGGSSVADLVRVIEALFGEAADMRGCVILCSGHKSKGQEWERVHILGLDELTVRTSRDWQRAQEVNLAYVMSTRSKDTLFLVSGVKEEQAPKG